MIIILPISLHNISKVINLLCKLGQPKGTLADEVANPTGEHKGQPSNIKGVQQNEEAVLSTSSCEFVDSADEEALKISHFRKHDVIELDEESRKSTLGTQLVWR